MGLSVSGSIIESHHGCVGYTQGALRFAFSIHRRLEGVADSQNPGATKMPAEAEAVKLHEDFVKFNGELVSVVDDDESVRESLPDLLREFGFTARVFSSAEEFLTSDCVDRTRCLLLDVAMPGMSGPDLQRELARRRQQIPIIFITAHSSGSARSRVLQQGAVECLFKPFSDTALLKALDAAFQKS
ncbi:MAG: response regulator [Terracidiphilus sp.]